MTDDEGSLLTPLRVERLPLLSTGTRVGREGRHLVPGPRTVQIRYSTCTSTLVESTPYQRQY